MLKRFCNVILVILAACIFCISLYGAYYYTDAAFDGDTYEGDDFHNLPSDSIDVLVLGSSHAQYSFVPAFFYEDTGLYSYVLGSACQPLEVSYQMLKEALKTQSPKLVILEVFTATPLRSMCEADSCYVMGGYQMHGKERITTFNYLEKEKASTYYNDFVNNHNKWRELENIDSLLPNNVLFQQEDSEISQDFGYVFQAGNYYYPENWWHASYPIDDVGEVKLDELDLDSLNNIYALCQENGIKLILYKTPIDSMSAIDGAYLTEVFKWADGKGVSYVNFFEKQEELDFYMCIHSDSFHCNIAGANLITGYLADFVNEQGYDFNHVSLIYLDEILDSAFNYYLNELFYYEHDPMKIAKRLANYKGYLLIRYNSSHTALEENVSEFFKTMGLESILKDDGDSYCLYHNGQLIYQTNDSFSYEINGSVLWANRQAMCIKDTYLEFKPTDLSIVCIDEQTDELINKDINIDTLFEYDFLPYRR